MLKDFLEELYQKKIDERYELNKKTVELLNQIRETDRFIELLDEKNDPNFEGFTPREVNPKNKEQIRSLKEKKKKLQEEYETVREQIKQSDEAVKQIQTMIDESTIHENEFSEMQHRLIYEQKRIAQITACVSREIEATNTEDHKKDKKAEEIPSGYQQIKSKLELALRVLDVDRNRARMELQQIVKILNETDADENLPESDLFHHTSEEKSDGESAGSNTVEDSDKVPSDQIGNCIIEYDPLFASGVEEWIEEDHRTLFDYMVKKLLNILSDYTDKIKVRYSTDKTISFECSIEEEKQNKLHNIIEKEADSLISILLCISIELEMGEEDNCIIRIHSKEV